MKKIISVFLIVSIILSCFSLCAFAEGEDNLPRFSEVKNLGRLQNSAMIYGDSQVCYDKEGNPLVCLYTQGGYFYVFDLVTGELKSEHRIGISAKTGFVRSAPDNKIYIHVYPEMTWRIYDPLTDTLTFENYDLKYGWGTLQGGCRMHDDGWGYSGIYEDTGTRVIGFNIYTKETVSYGPYDANPTYVKGIAVDDEYVYAGTGTGAENVEIFKINKKTGEATIHFKNPGGGIIYDLTLSGDKLYAYHYGKMSIIDKNTMELIDQVSIESSIAYNASPYDGNLMYTGSSNKGIYEYNALTREYKKVADHPIEPGHAVELQGWAQLPNHDWVLLYNPGGDWSSFGYFNPRTGETTTHYFDFMADTGPNVQSIEVDKYGIAYVGGYQTSMGLYNTYTNERLTNTPTWHQNEGLGALDGKMYFGIYSGGYIYRYDPETPWTYKSSYEATNDLSTENPVRLHYIRNGQDRPFVVEGYNGKLYVGSCTNYNEYGGALTVLTDNGAEAPEVKTYRNVIQDQSITGIAVKDNLCYVSSTVRNGLGTTPRAQAAEIAVFDLNKEEVITHFIPDLPAGVGKTAQTIGDLSFGPDGLLWGTCEKEGLVFAMDPETFEIVKYAVTDPGEDVGAIVRQQYMMWGDDGLLYTDAGWTISVVDPETMEFKQLAPTASIMTIDDHGNLWYCRGGSTFKIEINQYDRLIRFLKTLEKLKKEDYTEDEWAQLQLAIEEAKTFTEETDFDTIKYAIRNMRGLRDKEPYIKPQNAMDIVLNGEKMELDDDLTGVTRIYNGRTMIPYRVFLETLGYEVDWNVHSQTITATKEDSTLSMTINSDKYIINGEGTTFDTTPIIIYGRQYIPVRLIAEKLGYEVNWNENENTVYISEK